MPRGLSQGVRNSHLPLWLRLAVVHAYLPWSPLGHHRSTVVPSFDKRIIGIDSCSHLPSQTPPPDHRPRRTVLGRRAAAIARVCARAVVRADGERVGRAMGADFALAAKPAAVPQRAAWPARLARCLAGSFFFAKVGILRNTSKISLRSSAKTRIERSLSAWSSRMRNGCPGDLRPRRRNRPSSEELGGRALAARETHVGRAHTEMRAIERRTSGERSRVAPRREGRRAAHERTTHEVSCRADGGYGGRRVGVNR